MEEGQDKLLDELQERLRIPRPYISILLRYADVWLLDLTPPNDAWFSAGFWISLGYGNGRYDQTYPDWRTVVEADDLVAFDELLESVEQTSRPEFQLQVHFHRQDGKIIPFAMRASVFKGDRGRPVGLLGTLEPVLSRARPAAEAAEQRLAELASAISHDFRAAARGIATCTGWLEESWPEAMAPDDLENFDFLKQRTRWLSLMIRDGVLFARTAISDESPRQVDVQTAVVDVVAELPVASAGRIAIEGQLPARRFAPAALRTVFTQLLDNATRFSSGAITVRASTMVDAVRFEVSDEGPGLRPEHHDWIFRLFTRLDPKQSDRTGVGLSLCKAIIEREGGQIGIRSDGQSGTTVWFTILD